MARKRKPTLSDLDFSKRTPSWAAQARQGYLQRQATETNAAAKKDAASKAAEEYLAQYPDASAEEVNAVYQQILTGEDQTTPAVIEEPSPFASVESSVSAPVQEEEPGFFERAGNEFTRATTEIGQLVDVAQGGLQRTGAAAVEQLPRVADRSPLAAALTRQAGALESLFRGDFDGAAASITAPLKEVAASTAAGLRTDATANALVGEELRGSLEDRTWIERELGGGLIDAASSPSGALSVVGGPAGLLAVGDVYAQSYSEALNDGLSAEDAEVFAWSQAAPESIAYIPAGKLLERIPVVGKFLKKKATDATEGLVRRMANPNLQAATTLARTAVGEGLEEATTGALQDLANAALAGQEKATELSAFAGERAPKSIEEFMSNRYRDARAGVVMGGAGGTLAARGDLARYDTAKAQEQALTTAPAVEQALAARTAAPVEPVAPVAPAVTPKPKATKPAKEDPAARKKDLATIHVAKRAAGLDDATYRTLLRDTTGKESAADLTPEERTAVAKKLSALPPAPAATPAAPKAQTPRVARPAKPDKELTDADIRAQVEAAGITAPAPSLSMAGEAAPSNKASTEAELTDKIVQSVKALSSKNTDQTADVQNLLRQGKLVFASDQASLGRSETNAAAEYDPKDNKMYLYLDRVDPKDVTGVTVRALHEATHAGQFNDREGRPDIYRQMMGNKGNADANAKIRNAAQAGNRLAMAAVQKAQAAGGQEGEITNLELVPYFVGEAVAARGSTLGQLGGVARDVRSAAREFVRKNLGVNLDVDLTDLDTASQRVGGEVVQTDMSQAREGDPLDMIAGPLAKDFNKAKAAGKTYVGRVDQKERFEVPDNQAEVATDSPSLHGLLGGETVPLEEILSHENLYAQYEALNTDNGTTRLGNINVRINPRMGAGVRGQWNGSEIEVAPNVVFSAVNGDPENLRTLLLHETQHAVQQHEGFIGGANKSSFVDPKFKADLDLSNERLDNFIKTFELGVAENSLPPSSKAQWAQVQRTAGSPTDRSTKAELFLKQGFADDSTNPMVQRAGRRYKEVRANQNNAAKAFNKAEADAFRTYLRDYGEGEARNTEVRSRMPDEGLAYSPPEETMGLDSSAIGVEEMVDTRPLAKDRRSLPSASETAAPSAGNPQTKTKAFKDWFGDSKIVDENGEPAVWWRGNKSGNTAFRLNNKGLLFAAPARNVASGYTIAGENPWDSGGLFPIYIRSENPMDYENPEHVNAVVAAADTDDIAAITPNQARRMAEGDWDVLENGDVIAAIKAAGFDGFYVMEEGSKNIAVFSPNAVKSATDNSGEFSRTNNSILAMATPTPTVPAERLSNKERLTRILAHGTREQTADIKYAEDLDTRLREATKLDTGSTMPTDEVDAKIKAALTSMENATPEGRVALWRGFAKTYPNMAPVLMEARDAISQASRDIIANMVNSGRPLSAQERKQIQTLLANEKTYLARAYAAYQQGLGGKWAKDRWSNYKNNLEKYVADAGRLSPKVQKDVRDVINAIDFFRKELTIPSNEVLEDMSKTKLESLYERNVGPVERLQEQDDEGRMAEMVNALAQVRDSIAEADVDQLAEETAKAMLGLSGTDNKYAKQLSALARDPGNLKKRKVVPEEVRALLGEITTSPGVILSTLSSQAALKARSQVIKELLQDGVGTLVIPPSQLKELGKDGKDWKLMNGTQYGQLDGYYATPRVYNALTDSIEAYNTYSEALKLFGDDYMILVKKLADDITRKGLGTVNRTSKLMTVVGNPFNWMGNLIGSPMSVIGAGNLNPKAIGKGMWTAADYVAGTAQNTTTPLLEDAIRYLNIEAADVAELQHVLGNKMKNYLDGSLNPMEADSLIRKAILAGNNFRGRAFRTTVATYAILDNWSKIANFHHRAGILKAYYDAAGVKKSRDDILKEAGDSTSYTNFSPERAPSVVRGAESRGLTQFGPYFWEVFRTRLTGYSQAYMDLQRARETENPEAANIMYRAAASRLIGHTLATAGMPLVGAIKMAPIIGAAALMLGGDDDEAEKKRRMVAEFSADQDLVQFGVNKDGMPVYLPISQRVDPNGPMTDMIRIMTYAETPKDAAEGLWNYAKGDLVIFPRWLKATFNAATEDKVSEAATARIFPQIAQVLEDDVGISPNSVNKIMSIADSFTPGFVRSQDPRNKPDIEWKAEQKTEAAITNALHLSGARFETLDPQTRLKQYNDESSQRKRSNRAVFNDNLIRTQNLTKAKLNEWTQEYQLAEYERLQEDYRNIQSLRAWGFDDDAIAAAMKEAGWAKKEVPYLMAGEANVSISVESIKDFVNNSRSRKDKRIGDEYKESANRALEMLQEMQDELEEKGILIEGKLTPIKDKGDE